MASKRTEKITVRYSDKEKEYIDELKRHLNTSKTSEVFREALLFYYKNMADCSTISISKSLKKKIDELENLGIDSDGWISTVLYNSLTETMDKEAKYRENLKKFKNRE